MCYTKNKFVIAYIAIWVTVLVALIFFYIREQMVSHLQRLIFIESFINCKNITHEFEVYQHGDYWVIKNFINAQDISCNDNYTMILQGTYKDIYKLQTLHYDDLFDGFISFALFIPGEQDLQRTLAAIAYIRHCAVNTTAIFMHVSFHLYFRYQTMPFNVDFAQLSIQQKKHLKCGSNLMSELLEEGVMQANSSDSKLKLHDQHAVIVGRNIAQSAAATKYILFADFNTYPKFDLFASWRQEIYDYGTELEGGIKNTVFHVPMFLIQNLQIDDFNARHNLNKLLKLTGNASYRIIKPTYRLVFQTTITPPPKFSFIEKINELLRYPTCFLADNDIPLYPEDFGLSMAQSEDLRIFVMTQLHYNFIESTTIYVLRNITTPTTNGLAKNSELKSIDEEIKEQYRYIYGTMGKEL